MTNVRKALAAAAGLLAQIIAAGVFSGSAQAWAQIGLAAVTAIGVYLIPNIPST